MKIVSAFALVALVGCGPRYQYVQENGTPMRIDQDGRVAVLKNVNGAATWVALPTQGDLDKERTRCAPRKLPKDQALLVRITAEEKDGLWDVTNASTWSVQRLTFESGDTASPFSPTPESPNPYWEPTSEVGPGGRQDFFSVSAHRGYVVKDVLGKPADCRS